MNALAQAEEESFDGVSHEQRLKRLAGLLALIEKASADRRGRVHEMASR